MSYGPYCHSDLVSMPPGAQARLEDPTSHGWRISSQASPWPGDFGGFATAPVKPAAPVQAPVRRGEELKSPALCGKKILARPAPSRGKDPFDDLDIFKPLGP